MNFLNSANDRYFIDVIAASEICVSNDIFRHLLDAS